MNLNDQDITNLLSLINEGYIRKAEHPTLPLFIYNYTPKTQFEQVWNNITRITRGLVLDETYQFIIKCPEKFFNKGEPFASSINLFNCRISEKLDGYYISIKQDSKYGLIITSRGSFHNQYTEAVKSFLTPNVIEQLKPDYTYFCELCQNFAGDEAIILTQHPTPKLVCWAIRDNLFQEVIPNSSCPLPIAKKLSLSEAKKYLQQKVEGVVAQDLNTFERVKIKTEWFIQHHRILSDCTKKRAWEILSQGKLIQDLDIPDEMMPKMQQYEKELMADYQNLWSKILKADYETSELTDKELGLLNKYQDLKPYIFLLRKDKDQQCFNKIWHAIQPRNVI